MVQHTISAVCEVNNTLFFFLLFLLQRAHTSIEYTGKDLSDKHWWITGDYVLENNWK